jgi:hypothetical protein
MVCPPVTSEAGILSAKVVSCSNINGYLRNYQDCLTLARQLYGRLMEFPECLYIIRKCVFKILKFPRQPVRFIPQHSTLAVASFNVYQVCKK